MVDMSSWADEVFGPDALVDEHRPARAYGRLHVVDVSNIEHPREVAWYEPEYGGVHNVWSPATRSTWARTTPGSGHSTFRASCGATCGQNREIAHVNPIDQDGFIPTLP